MNIRRHLLGFLVLIFSFCSAELKANTLLDDKDVVRDMMGRGVPAKVIFAARKEQTKQTVTDLIVAAADNYPLEQIFQLYPTGGAGAASAAEISGEDTFFEACAKNPTLYARVFEGFTHSYFVADGHPYNPLAPQPYTVVTTDLNKVKFTPYIICFRVRHTQMIFSPDSMGYV